VRTIFRKRKGDKLKVKSIFNVENPFKRKKKGVIKKMCYYLFRNWKIGWNEL